MDIFIVDDSAAIRDHIAALLESIPNTKVTGLADDAPEAIHDISQGPPDVLVLDIRLRASNGMDVLRFVASKYPATKVFILSNHAEKESRELFLDAGAHQFFDKSLEFDKLHDEIAALASSSPGGRSR